MGVEGDGLVARERQMLLRTLVGLSVFGVGAAMPVVRQLDYDALGYVASFLVFGTFCMKDVVHLRLTAILSNIAFTAYGLALDAPPIWSLHLALLPTNIWRLYGVTQSSVAPTASERNAAASIGK